MTSPPPALLPLLPQLPALPKPGARLDLPALAGSADALALAQLAGGGRMLAVVTANPLDAQRLQEEIAWFAPQLRVHLLPDWETLPYDTLSPHHDLISERLATLYEISRGACDIALIPATTALTRLAPAEYLAAHTFFLKQGERLDVGALRAQLALAGYQHVTQVVSPGEYSVRGGLIDLFPMGSALPFRIELFDEEIETLRSFDVDSQRTVFPVPEVRLLPAREFPLDEAGRTRFRGRYRETFEGDPSRSPIYKDVSNGIAPAGIEYYLPLFFDDNGAGLRLPAEGHGAVPAPRRARRHPRVLGRHGARATGCSAATAAGRCCRRRSCSSPRSSSSSPPPCWGD
jgi:transcription-repair coupling factor (superfamily II helicase)